MTRSMLFVLLPCLASLAGGCAGVGEETRRTQTDQRLEGLLQAEQRLEMRMDEVTRNVIALRERMDAQEAKLKALSEAEREPAESPTPEPPTVKEEPLPPEPPPEARPVAPPG
ncbi:MAG: hypothetical protein HY900_31165, partial [Deltaproteobacteria bacterium]|nr:hypothetical protein [Deltaproteobacteria bacterium]